MLAWPASSKCESRGDLGATILPILHLSRLRTSEKQYSHCSTGLQSAGFFGHHKEAVGEAMAARSPEPCQGTSATSGNWPAAPKVHLAGRKRVRPGFSCFSLFGASRASAKRGPGSRLPASACQHRCRKKQKRDRGRDRIARQPEERQCTPVNRCALPGPVRRIVALVAAALRYLGISPKTSGLPG